MQRRGRSRALVERARAGVQVRVLLDGFGRHGRPRERSRRCEARAARSRSSAPARFGKLTRFHKRNHRRAIVIDGRRLHGRHGRRRQVAGRRRHARSTGATAWSRVTGPAGRDLQSAFVGRSGRTPRRDPGRRRRSIPPPDRRPPGGRAPITLHTGAGQLALQRRPPAAAVLHADASSPRGASSTSRRPYFVPDGARARRSRTGRGRAWTCASCCPTSTPTPSPSATPATATTRSCWTRACGSTSTSRR